MSASPVQLTVATGFRLMYPLQSGLRRLASTSPPPFTLTKVGSSGKPAARSRVTSAGTDLAGDVRGQVQFQTLRAEDRLVVFRRVQVGAFTLELDDGRLRHLLAVDIRQGDGQGVVAVVLPGAGLHDRRFVGVAGSKLGRALRFDLQGHGREPAIRSGTECEVGALRVLHGRSRSRSRRRSRGGRDWLCSGRGLLGVGRLQRILGAPQIQPRALHVVGGGELDGGQVLRLLVHDRLRTHHAGRRRCADRDLIAVHGVRRIVGLQPAEPLSWPSAPKTAVTSVSATPETTACLPLL